MKEYLLFILLLAINIGICAQDTFSIVALDTATGEVGSAGASCVDLTLFPQYSTDFLGELFPGQGAINTQAYYLEENQENARERMNLGQGPQQIINWLINNDHQGQPQLRQYGIVGYFLSTAQGAAHTGTSTDDFKGHRTGYNYAIQGNILAGPEILDSMESNFLNAEGDLACKLMAAMQGANVAGADSRCLSNGSSSLFAFLKVAQESDTFGDPSFNIGVRTANNQGIEPIDSLQVLFDLSHDSCLNETPLNLLNEKALSFDIYPNPSKGIFTLHIARGKEISVMINDVNGRIIQKFCVSTSSIEIDISKQKKGIYYLKIESEDGIYSKQIFKD